jgi:hypothetical protein
MAEDLPKWRVFFAGEPYIWVTTYARPGAIPTITKTYLLDPSVVDGVSPLILVPQTAEGVDLGTGEWIKLSAALLRNRGLGYFMRVIEKYGLGVRDLIVIRSLLKDIEAIPVEPVSALRDASFANYEGEPEPGAPGDRGPDNHTVGPWGGPGRSSSPSRPAGPVQAKQPPGHPGSPLPPSPRGTQWRSPNGDPRGFSSRDALNGLNPSDNPESNYPGWDDPKRDPSMREVFRCDGHVYFGYRNLCPDYNLLPNERWSFALDRFSVRLVGDRRNDPAWIRPWILHKFLNDGKNPECMANARRVSELACGAAYGTPFAACALVPGCWPLFVAAASTPVGIIGVLELGLSINECMGNVQGYAAEHVCTK